MALIAAILALLAAYGFGSDGGASAVPQQPQTATISDALPGDAYVVTRVVDGDTLKVMRDGTAETVRLIGIDTPESVDPRKPVQCFATQASDEAKRLMTGQEVTLETDPTQGERDRYGRLLAYVRRADGLFLNEHLIAEGFGHEYTYDQPYRYQAAFRDAERSARAAGKGLWGQDVCPAS